MKCALLVISITVLFLPNIFAQSTNIGGSIERDNKLTKTMDAFGHYADSLNFLNENESLPRFLSDTLLDFRSYEYLGLYTQGYYYSFRKSVLDRVVNERSLQRIIESPDISYDYIYDPIKLRKKRSSRTLWVHDYVNLPYQEVSIRELARLRLEFIKKTWKRKK